MIRLTPLELRGQMFGFFNLASRVASALGPLRDLERHHLGATQPDGLAQPAREQRA